jgi:hypothetical protein
MEFLGALNRRTSRATCPLLSSFTRLERRKSLIKRHRLVSCRAAQVKLYRRISLDCVEINRAAAGNLENY